VGRAGSGKDSPNNIGAIIVISDWDVDLCEPRFWVVNYGLGSQFERLSFLHIH
jgi:hypothetical protein